MISTVRRFVLIFCCVIGTGCSQGIRIEPGKIPAPEPLEEERVSVAHEYIVEMINEEDYAQIVEGDELTRIRAVIDRLSIAAGYPAGAFPLYLVEAGEYVNAAAVNGSSIVVYRALLDKVRSEDELATVLSHEIGHIMAKHYQDLEEEERRAKGVALVGSLFGAVADVATSFAGYNGLSGLAGGVADTATRTVGYGAFVGSFSRVQEYEADHIGLLLMAKAGYDPKVAVSFWERSEEVFGTSSSSLGAFLSSHPASSDRAEELQEALSYTTMGEKTFPLASQ
ncbi:M48 family metalloprotease [bacterium]|nr:M48 family metalloprotease [bacterium]